MTTVGILAAGLGLMICVAPASAADAPEVYAKKCRLCHSIGGEGGKKKDVGGPIDGVAAKRDEAWLRAYIAEPKSKIAESKMPKIKLSPEDVDALVRYLLTLK
jgi:cytochrome c2